MTDLETLIRDTLHEHAQAISPSDLTSRTYTAGHRHPRLGIGLLLAVVVFALVAAIAMGVAYMRSTRPPIGVPASPVPIGVPASPVPIGVPASPVPIGDKAVSYHGISLAVPDRFAIDADPCGAPASDAVLSVDDGKTLFCPALTLPPNPGVLTQIIGLMPDIGSGYTRLAKQPITIDGTPARIFDGPATGTAIDIPDPGVLIMITGPDHGTVAHALLATIRITPVDALGCPAQLTSLLPTSNPPATTLIPGHPTSGTLCSYMPANPGAAHWLDGSQPLTATQLTGITDFLNRQPLAGVAPGDSDLRGLAVRYLLTYPDGTHRTLAVQFNYLIIATDGHLKTTATPATCAIGCPLPDPFYN